jgi:hypothetical protein
MGMPAVPPPSRFNFAAHLLGCNGGRAAKTAYIDDQQSLSYGELAQRVQKDGRRAGRTRHTGAKNASSYACTTRWTSRLCSSVRCMRG